MIITSVDGKVIGTLEGGVFTKRVRNLHQLHTPPAWAVDARAYRENLVGNCHTIVVDNIESGLRYTVSLKIFEQRKGFLSRGYGDQYFLPLKFWQVTSAAQMILI